MLRFNLRTAIAALSGCLGLLGLVTLVHSPAEVREALAAAAESVVGAAPAWAEQAQSRRASMTDPAGTVSDVENEAFEGFRKKHGLTN